MRHVRMLGLCLLAVFVVGAVAASGASAKLPEFGRCEPTEGGTGGRYGNASCTAVVKPLHGAYLGSYEWHPLVGEEILIPLGLSEPFVFETAAGVRIECTGVGPSDLGELFGAKAVRTPLWVLESCHAGETSFLCQSTLAPEEGEISNFLSWLGEGGSGWPGQLGLVKKGAEPVVGIDYTVLNHERAYPPISCEGGLSTIWVGGSPKGSNSFISTIGPVDQMTETFTEKLSESGPGVATPTKLLGHGKAGMKAFRGSEWEPVAMTGTWTEQVENDDEHPIEIKAMP